MFALLTNQSGGRKLAVSFGAKGSFTPADGPARAVAKPVEFRQRHRPRRQRSQQLLVPGRPLLPVNMCSPIHCSARNRETLLYILSLVQFVFDFSFEFVKCLSDLIQALFQSSYNTADSLSR